MKIYKHKNGKKYIKLLQTKIKNNGVWEDCVIYMCLYWNKDKMIWVRFINDFNENFK